MMINKIMYKNLSKKSIVLINTSPNLVLDIKSPIINPEEIGESLKVTVRPVKRTNNVIFKVYTALLSLN
ncbi:hypothetical protein OWM07_09700 [Deferribacter thermophilus]|uniref:hypothetical protein n=1 Tax=Deferribacter thermophilus TaxID=53573 RepID=UPI003C1D93FC